ncbi:MAG: hypothetical protein H0T52_16385 [Lautropia sp.]|nr:hypothetical protein [Lautropia sp.]
MDVAFGILSSWESPPAVSQMVDCLASHGSVFIHHDYSKQPDFPRLLSHAYVIQHFTETGWGSPGFVQAVFQLIRTALERSDFDFFQLLSGSCLPIRPIPDLMKHLASNGSPIRADVVDLDTDERVLMSHGHRVLCRADALAFRLLGRARRWYLGSNPITIHHANLGIPRRAEFAAKLTALQWVGRQIHSAARAGLLDKHPFRSAVKPFVGSLWFCLRRDVCEFLVQQEQSNPLMPYLLSLNLCDEIVFPTLLGNSKFAVGASNHLVNDFVDAHPRVFVGRDLPALADSGKFFARKFSGNVNDETRQTVLRQIEGRQKLFMG